MTKAPTHNDGQEALFQVMLERHAARDFDKNYTISDEDLKTLLKMASTAPSSWDLQHWKYLVLKEQTSKERLLPIAYNQKQIQTASVIIVLLADKEADKNAARVYDDAVKQGHMTKEIADSIISQIETAYKNPSIGHDEGLRNASLAGMQLMLAAQGMGIDSCPMGGFDKEALQKEFSIPSRYVPTMIIALGKEINPQKHSTAMRFPIEETLVLESF